MIYSMINWYFDYSFYLSSGVLLIYFCLDSKHMGWFFSYLVSTHLFLVGLSSLVHGYYCENEMRNIFLISGIFFMLAGISLFHRGYILRLLKIIK